MKILFTLLIISLLGLQSFGQGCGLISKSKDRKTGIESKGGIATSKDFYSLLIQKQFDKHSPQDLFNYNLMLIAASRYELPDSLLKSKGAFVFYTANGQSFYFKDAECFNNSTFGTAIGFTVKATERQLQEIANQEIVRVKVFELLETEFSAKAQKQIQQILNCLKSEFLVK